MQESGSGSRAAKPCICLDRQDSGMQMQQIIAYTASLNTNGFIKIQKVKASATEQKF